jgi:hypothetical protein
MCTGTETYGGGPQSYILRLSGPSEGNWSFWLEVKFDAALNLFSFTIKAELLFWLIIFQASSSEALRVDLSVLDQKLVGPAKTLKNAFPNWVDVVGYSNFLSTYTF